MSAAAAIASALLWAAWSAASGVARIERSIEERPTREEVRQMVGAVHHWTAADMGAWIKLFRAQEPALKIPDPK